MASSGIVWRDHQPATAAAATNRKTRKRLRAENSMIRSITGLPPAAAFNWLSESIRKLPEVTMRSPAREAAQDLDAPVALRPDGHLRAARSCPLPRSTKTIWRSPEFEHRRSPAPPASARRPSEVPLAPYMSGLSSIAGIIELHPHFERAGGGVHLRQDVAHLPVEDARPAGSPASAWPAGPAARPRLRTRRRRPSPTRVERSATV